MIEAAAALAVQVGDLLRSQGKTLAVAESCTGGLLGDLLTDVPGSSVYFLGGVLAYSNAVKMALLNVRHATLLRHGAVSAECAAEMAEGARRLLYADLAISITGIAGPDGGSAHKPVGLVYIHLSSAAHSLGLETRSHSDRRGNKQHAARAALQLLADTLSDFP